MFCFVCFFPYESDKKQLKDYVHLEKQNYVNIIN